MKPPVKNSLAEKSAGLNSLTGNYSKQIGGNMQSGKTKAERKATAAARALARPALRKARKDARVTAQIAKRVQALTNEDRKRAASKPSAIAEVAAEHKAICENHKVVMAEVRAEKKAKRATIPAEAASNVSAN
jgi:hypothetical protein